MLSEDIVSAFVNWLPVVVFVVAFLFLNRKQKSYYDKYNDNVAEFSKFYAEILTVNKEMAATLIQIRKMLEDGKP